MMGYCMAYIHVSITLLLNQKKKKIQDHSKILESSLSPNLTQTSLISLIPHTYLPGFKFIIH